MAYTNNNYTPDPNRAEGAALFSTNDGWAPSKRPKPYDEWGLDTRDPSAISIYHDDSRPNALPTKLHAGCVKALLNIMQGEAAEIGISKTGPGSYAAQYALSNGSTFIATLNAGELTAAIRNPEGVHRSVASLGSDKTKDFDTAPILALFICYEADRNAVNGVGSVADNAVTWEMLDSCKSVFKDTGVMDRRTLYLVNDTLYCGLAKKGGIPCNIKQGNIDLLTNKVIDNCTYHSADIICGHPDIFTPPRETSVLGCVTFAAAKEEYKHYWSKLVWTEEEEKLIPNFPDNMEVPVEVLTFARRFVKSRGFKVPINNMCWRGGTGFGKSTGAEMLACILHTPFVRITCSEQTELQDFLSQFVPNPDSDVGTLTESLPTFDEIAMDPVGAYEMMTGRIDESVDAETVMKLRDEALVARSNAAHFKLVVSPFVTALERGWIVEPSEFGRIRSSGTLVGLNNFDKPGSRIPLPTGGFVVRHHDAMVLWTDNSGYNSCRPVDPSFLRRMDFIIDSRRLDKTVALNRIRFNTGFQNDLLLDQMYEIWEEIIKFCKDKDIMEGDISVVELEKWVQLVQIEGEAEIKKTCLEAVVSKASADEETQAEIMDGCVSVVMSRLTAAL